MTPVLVSRWSFDSQLVQESAAFLFSLFSSLYTWWTRKFTLLVSDCITKFILKHSVVSEHTFSQLFLLIRSVKMVHNVDSASVMVPGRCLGGNRGGNFKRDASPLKVSKSLVRRA